MKFKSILIFGAPGSGKGTQGKVLGTIPGFFHLSCGDVFRSLDLRSEVGKIFLEFSGRGSLVPDDITVRLWQQQIENLRIMSRYKPDIDLLVLDGIPRNLAQARAMREKIEVTRVFHLACPNRAALVERMKRRALKDNRLDDANEEIILQRLDLYDRETRPVLDFYGPERVVEINATQWPFEVLRDILLHLDRGPVPA